ncbi:hypothetical protein HYFRA_00000151 [Hymenoscyphus fraxineus]|uniref:Uncharacterized protein n=1 Tax=Hymenoscyphus fraxineus TaxID=746836 RepID=A0A9N9L5B7_9HELO|nr:hypothetical protein HYFRA_00000151 [Hymenoscyphus fraxineus]
MRPFHEAVYAFGLEWARDADRIGLEFLKSEKALFEEAAASLPPSVRERYDAITEIPCDWAGLTEKKKKFALKKHSLLKMKLFFEKVKTRPFGIWFRPTWDTIILREEDIDDNAVQVVCAFREGESNSQNACSQEASRPALTMTALGGRRRPRRTTPEDTEDEDPELLDDSHESNAEVAKPLLTGLDELIVLVNRGFYHHFVDGKRIDDTHEEVNDLKQKMHDKILNRMKHRSALTKIPKISIEREDHMYGWTR